VNTLAARPPVPEVTWPDMAFRDPAVVAAIRPFRSRVHLPPVLCALSAVFAQLAATLVGELPDDPELVAALNKLRESKDRAVGLLAFTLPDTRGRL
jgi:hypothetical protein